MAAALAYGRRYCDMAYAFPPCGFRAKTPRRTLWLPAGREQPVVRGTYYLLRTRGWTLWPFPWTLPHAPARMGLAFSAGFGFEYCAARMRGLFVRTRCGQVYRRMWHFLGWRGTSRRSSTCARRSNKTCQISSGHITPSPRLAQRPRRDFCILTRATTRDHGCPVWAPSTYLKAQPERRTSASGRRRAFWAPSDVVPVERITARTARTGWTGSGHSLSAFGEGAGGRRRFQVCAAFRHFAVAR